MTARRYRVHGRVQGVGFRHFVFVQASALGPGLTGWVRNRADGTVEVLAQGSDAQLAALREMLEEGPAGSRVTAVHEDDAAVAETAGLDGFGIAPTKR